MISGRSEEESGRGFARIKEIASSVTVFTIFIFLITREFAAKKTEGEDLNPVLVWRMGEMVRSEEEIRVVWPMLKMGAELFEGFFFLKKKMLFS